MIIQCEKCKTRFRLDDSKVSEAGVRVRCSRCSHTFVVTRDVPEEDQDFDSILLGLGDAPNEPERTAEPPEEPESPAEQALSAWADTPATEQEENEQPAEAEEPGPADDAELRQEESEAGDPFAELFGKGGEAPHFEKPSDSAEEAEDIFAEEPEKEEPQPAVDTAASDASPDTGSDDDELPSEIEEMAPRSGEPDRVDVVQPDLHGSVRWPVADGDEEAAGEDELPPLSISSRRKGARLLPVLLGILLVLILAAVGYIFMNGNAGGPLGALSARVKQLVGAGEKTPAAAVRSLEGEFVSNREAGELFVMRGEVVNNSGKPVASLRVKGTVYGANGVSLAERTVFCGNTLSREQLAFQPYSSMERLMGRQFGDTLVNLEVLPGKAVPFLIVFRNLPKGASDFGAAVFDTAVQ